MEGIVQVTVFKLGFQGWETGTRVEVVIAMDCMACDMPETGVCNVTCVDQVFDKACNRHLSRDKSVRGVCHVTKRGTVVLSCDKVWKSGFVM